MDYNVLSTYPDPISPKVGRIDYTEIIDRLTFSHNIPTRHGMWTLVAISDTRQPAKRLKKMSEESWLQVEVFTRRARPTKNGTENLPYEIWARIRPQKTDTQKKEK